MKNLLLVTLVLFAMVSFVGFEPLDEMPYMKGDIDMDYCITQNDMNLAMNFAVGITVPTHQEKIIADMNNDNRVNSADVSLINNLIGICYPY